MVIDNNTSKLVAEIDIEEMKLIVNQQVKNSQRDVFIKNIWSLFSFNLVVLGFVFTFLAVFIFLILKSTIRDEISDYNNKRGLQIASQKAEFDNLKQTAENMVEQVNDIVISIKSKDPSWDENVQNIIREKVDQASKDIKYQNLMLKGISAFTNKSYELAIDYFKGAKIESPGNINPLYNLALSYKKLRPNSDIHYAEVFQYLQEAVDAGFNDKNEAISDGFNKYLKDSDFKKLFPN